MVRVECPNAGERGNKHLWVQTPDVKAALSLQQNYCQNLTSKIITWPILKNYVLFRKSVSNCLNWPVLGDPRHFKDGLTVLLLPCKYGPKHCQSSLCSLRPQVTLPFSTQEVRKSLARLQETKEASYR